MSFCFPVQVGKKKKKHKFNHNCYLFALRCRKKDVMVNSDEKSFRMVSIEGDSESRIRPYATSRRAVATKFNQKEREKILWYSERAKSFNEKVISVKENRKYSMLHKIISFGSLTFLSLRIDRVECIIL